MTTTKKQDGAYQVARAGLFTNYEGLFCTVDRGAQSTQGPTQAQRCNKCNNADMVC